MAFVKFGNSRKYGIDFQKDPWSKLPSCVSTVEFWPVKFLAYPLNEFLTSKFDIISCFQLYAVRA